MKDSSVSPAGLFDTRRQRKLLDGLAERFRHCVDQQRMLCEQHRRERTEDAEEFAHQRAALTAKCRHQRRGMLRQWDDAEEALTSHYESTAIRSRSELNRLAAVFRRKAAEERKSLELKALQGEQTAREQYENSKNRPGLKKRKELKRIDEALLPLQDLLARSRELTISRLDGLPDVPSSGSGEQEVPVEEPGSVDDAIASIGILTQQCEDVLQEMHRGRAAKVIDSFLLPIGAVAFVLLWAIIAYFVAPQPPWLWMLAGIILSLIHISEPTRLQV